MTISLIHDLLIILAAGLLAGLVCRILQTSVLVGYLVVGTVLGRGALGWVLNQDHQLEHFTEVGVFLLLFSIGLEFSLDEMRLLGRKLIIGGLVQMVLVAFPVTLYLVNGGIELSAAILVACAVAFSSTVLVFKSLSEYGQSEQPHGRRAIGILLFQDAALIPLLLLIPLLAGDSNQISVLQVAGLVITSVAFVAAVAVLRYFTGQWMVPLLAKYRSPDLVILITIVCLAGVTLAAYHIGLPPAVGAFAAGLIFNGNRWTKQIDALVLPLRETFAAIFFVSLGLIFDVSILWHQPVMLIGLIVGLVMLKAVAASVALLLTGLPWQRSVGMGLGLAHIGEFAFVLMLVGLDAEFISRETYQIVIAVSVASLILTPTMIKYGLRMADTVSLAEPDTVTGGTALPQIRHATVVGAGPVGRQVASQLETYGFDVGLVDISPINLHSFALQGFRTTVGDAGKDSTLRLAQTPDSELAVVCVPDDQEALRVVKAIRRLNKTIQIVVRCRYQSNAPKIMRGGANRVIGEDAVASTVLMQTLSSIVVAAIDPNDRTASNEKASYGVDA